MNKKTTYARKARPIVKKGDIFGRLTIITDPYMVESKGHRRQHVDCICECGKIRNQINSSYFKNNTIIYYCSKDCHYYRQDNPLSKGPKKESVKAKLGTKINYLEVIEEAFYHHLPGHTPRNKCVKVKCKCGNEKIYREDKFLSGQYKSCGCVWERSTENLTKKCKSCGKIKDNFQERYVTCKDCRRLKNIERKYNISQSTYLKKYKKADNVCEICKNKSSLVIDHCHKTNKVRGLICNNCNVSLGLLKENIETLNNCIDYLKKYNDNK